MLTLTAIFTISSCLFLQLDCVECKAVNVKTIDGLLVNIVDDCDPKDPNSCGEGKCCAKQTMMYIPEFFGPKPTYSISCQPLRTVGRMCFTDSISNEMCPCAEGLTCVPGPRYPYGTCHYYQ